jgi:hypothetical protein
MLGELDFRGALRFAALRFAGRRFAALRAGFLAAFFFAFFAVFFFAGFFFADFFALPRAAFRFFAMTLLLLEAPQTMVMLDPKHFVPNNTL